MTVGEFWKLKFPNMIDEAGVCEFAEAFREHARDEQVSNLLQMLDERRAELEATREREKRLREALYIVLELAPVRHTLRINHRYETGCNCEFCVAETAVMESEKWINSPSK